MLYIVFFVAEFLFYITYMGGLGSIQYFRQRNDPPT